MYSLIFLQNFLSDFYTRKTVYSMNSQLAQHPFCSQPPHIYNFIVNRVYMIRWFCNNIWYLQSMIIMVLLIMSMVLLVPGVIECRIYFHRLVQNIITCVTYCNWSLMWFYVLLINCNNYSFRKAATQINWQIFCKFDC